MRRCWLALAPRTPSDSLSILTPLLADSATSTRLPCAIGAWPHAQPFHASLVWRGQGSRPLIPAADFVSGSAGWC